MLVICFIFSISHYDYLLLAILLPSSVGCCGVRQVQLLAVAFTTAAATIVIITILLKAQWWRRCLAMMKCLGCLCVIMEVVMAPSQWTETSISPTPKCAKHSLNNLLKLVFHCFNFSHCNLLLSWADLCWTGGLLFSETQPPKPLSLVCPYWIS